MIESVNEFMYKVSLMSQETSDAIDKIVQTCFNGNALSDNVVYNLDVIFNMPKASDVFHHRFAHWFPLFADRFNDIQTKMNMLPKRLAVDEAIYQYENISECFNDVLTFMVNKLESSIKSALEIAESKKDKRVVIELENVYTDIEDYIKQAIIWFNKSKEYENNGCTHQFDIDFEDFTIISE